MFNLKKAKAESIQSGEAMLEDTLERKQSLENKTHGNTDWLLREVRQDDAPKTTTQGQLKGKHKDTARDKLTEGQLDAYEAPDGSVPGRAAGVDNLQMNPLAALNAAQEAEKIKAYNEASDGKRDTSFWDKMLGVQLNGKETTQERQVPASGSQLQNSYDRLKSLKTDDMGKHDKVKKMVMASMQDADAMLYFIYHKAASEGRELTKEESVLVNGITADKVRFASML